MIDNILQALGQIWFSFTGTTKTIKELRQLQKVRCALIHNGVIYGIKEPLYANVNLTKEIAKLPGIDRVFFIGSTIRDTKNEHWIFLNDKSSIGVDFDKYYDYYELLKNRSVNKMDEEWLQNEGEKIKFLNGLKPLDDYGFGVKLNMRDDAMSKEYSNIADKVMSSSIMKIFDRIGSPVAFFIFLIGVLTGSLLITSVTVAFLVMVAGK